MRGDKKFIDNQSLAWLCLGTYFGADLVTNILCFNCIACSTCIHSQSSCSWLQSVETVLHIACYQESVLDIACYFDVVLD